MSTFSTLAAALSPLAWWRLSDTGGTTIASDNTGNGRTGVYWGNPTQGAPGLIAGDSDGAITVTTSQWVAVDDAAWMDSTTGTYFLAFATTGTGDQYLFTRGYEYMAMDLRTSNVVRGYATINGTLRIVQATVTGLRDGNPHVAAVRFNGTTLDLFVDGTKVATGAYAGTLPNISRGIILGQRWDDSGRKFAGTLDEAMVLPGSVTDAQIADLSSAALTGGSPTVSGTLSGALPTLSASLAGGIEFSGTITATLPTLGANLSGETFPPGVAGDLVATLPPLGGSLAGAYSDTATLAAILPPLSASLAGTVLPPPVTGSLSANLPSLAANLTGTAYDPGTSGTLAALLPALTASLSGDVLGRTGLGLALDSSAVLTVEAALEPEPTVPPGTPSTALHIIAPTVPVPTLVAGRPQ